MATFALHHGDCIKGMSRLKAARSTWSSLRRPIISGSHTESIRIDRTAQLSGLVRGMGCGCQPRAEFNGLAVPEYRRSAFESIAAT